MTTTMPFLVVGAYYADLRSLAVFRICLGMYLLSDIFTRISLGKYDLAWYTSDPRERSYLEANDTPHKAPLHQVWFTRGSIEFQYATFALSAVLALCLLMGFYCHSITKLLLLLVTTHQQNTNFSTHDGSDAFVRHLLLWSIFLPLEETWSWKDYNQNRKHSKMQSTSTSNASNHSPTISGVAVLGILTQIVLMYAGTVCYRTIDVSFTNHLQLSDWLPPKLTAVHYALLDAFASRDNALTRFLIASPALTSSLTLATVILEGMVPIACWIFWSKRHYGAMILLSLHAGLLLVLNLPTWQYVGMLTQVLWIPTPVWDRWLSKKNNAHDDDVDAASPSSSQPLENYKKTDGDAVVSEPTTKTTTSKSPSTIRPLRPNIVSRGFQYFFFAYMIYNWCGNRGWIPKHDHGDIGESLRLSQWWIMYGSVGSNSAFTHLIGRRQVQSSDSSTTATSSTTSTKSFDLYHYLKTGEEQDPLPEYIVPHNMTDRYPSPRWERVLAQWANGKDRLGTKGRKFCATLCVLLNEDKQGDAHSNDSSLFVDTVELIYQSVHALPPGSDYYYMEERRVGHVEHPQIISVNCHNPNKPVPRVVPNRPEPVLAPRIKPPK